MKTLSPDLCKWNPKLAEEIYFGYFCSDESDHDEEPDRKRVRGGWKKRPQAEYEKSNFWMDHCVNKNCRDPLHRDGKQYRLDYRMPWVKVEWLIQTFKKEGCLEVKESMSTGQRSCPIEVKILGTLY